MKPLNVYACYNTDQDIRMGSSSGAVFSSLADYILSEQGIVYGVAMSEDCYSAEFIRVTDNSGLTRIRGSKYMQARVRDTFKQVKSDLLSGKMVLFTGTGCQVNGLRGFLRKEYENLICVDVICHGVPSPALWKKYAEYQEIKNGGKLKKINFRCKDEGWADFGMKEVLDGSPQGQMKKMYISKNKDSYMQMFLRDYCLRPSCYECVAKKAKMSDLTIADFWGIDKVAPGMNDGHGTSLVLIRTEKGRNTFEKISGRMKLHEVTYDEGVANNPAEYKSCKRPPERESFFDDMRSMSFEELEKKYAAPVKRSLKSRIKRKVKKMIKCLLRRNRGGAVRIMQNTDYFLCFVFEYEDR